MTSTEPRTAKKKVSQNAVAGDSPRSGHHVVLLGLLVDWASDGVGVLHGALPGQLSLLLCTPQKHETGYDITWIGRTHVVVHCYFLSTDHMGPLVKVDNCMCKALLAD